MFINLYMIDLLILYTSIVYYLSMGDLLFIFVNTNVRLLMQIHNKSNDFSLTQRNTKKPRNALTLYRLYLVYTASSSM